MENKIDFVITWVDGEDPKWLEERNKFVPENLRKQPDIAGDKRYSDNGLLKYLFRGIDKFAPWVRKIHFVTYGHLPEWLDVTHPKINIVKHEDFLPEEYRPTFSSVPLNLNLFRIKDLEEQFVYFNDDMFLVSQCNPDDFFKNGLPRDMGVQDVIPASAMEAYWYMVYNDIIMLNKNVNKREVLKKSPLKWVNPIYGKNMFKNILLWPFPLFTGFYETHLPASYLKSMYKKVWENNFELLDEVSRHKTRCGKDISENFIRYVQLAEGNFEPLNKLKTGRYCSMKSKNLPDYIRESKYKYICINDEVEGEIFERVREAFEQIFPQRSSFEKE